MERPLTDPVQDEARQLVEEGVSYYVRTPKAIAIAEFSSPRGRFVKGGRYIYVLDSTGVMVAHPINESFVGQDFYYVRDCEGKSFIKEIVDIANAAGSGWVEYKWLDPVTETERPKTVYFEKTHGVIICSGVYGGNPASGVPGGPDVQHDLPSPSADIFPSGRLATAARMDEPAAELVLDDARRFVEEAVAFLRSSGAAVALAEFSNPRGRFVRGELYLFVMDATGVMVAHGANQKYIGKNFYRIVDADGKQLVKEIVDTANSEGSGWVQYKWGDPITKLERPKIVYFERVNDVIICSGIYQR